MAKYKDTARKQNLNAVNMHREQKEENAANWRNTALYSIWVSYNPKISNFSKFHPLPPSLVCSHFSHYLSTQVIPALLQSLIAHSSSPISSTCIHLSDLTFHSFLLIWHILSAFLLQPLSLSRHLPINPPPAPPVSTYHVPAFAPSQPLTWHSLHRPLLQSIWTKMVPTWNITPPDAAWPIVPPALSVFLRILESAVSCVSVLIRIKIVLYCI